MAPRKQPNPVDVHVGIRLKQRRAMIGLTQERLGDKLGVTFQQVQKYEKGANRIGASRLQEIAKILDVPVSYFFEEADIVNGAPRVAHVDAPPAFGFAETGQQPLGEYPSTMPQNGNGHVPVSDTNALAKAFSQITDARVRRRIIDLVETLADGRAR